MTLVICKKIEDNSIVIHSDSKITDEYSTESDRMKRGKSPLSGTLKTVMLHPQVSLSFAGSSTIATDFLKSYFEGPKEGSIESTLKVLYELHLDNDRNVEFILCSCLGNSTFIHVIKDGEISRDVNSAWIGDFEAFELFQTYFIESKPEASIDSRSHTAFRQVVQSSKINSVGHYHIEVETVSDNKNNLLFLYKLKTESHIGSSKEIHLEAGESKALPLLGNVQDGGYAEIFFRSLSMKYAVAIYFPQGNFGLLFCPSIDSEYGINITANTPAVFLNLILETYDLPMEGIAMPTPMSFQRLSTIGGKIKT